MKLATVFKDIQFEDIELGYWINGAYCDGADFEDTAFFSPESSYTHIWLSFRGKYKNNIVTYDVIDENKQSIISDYLSNNTIPHDLLVYGNVPGGNVYIPYSIFKKIRSAEVVEILNKIKDSQYNLLSDKDLHLSDKEYNILKDFVLNEINRSRFTVQSDWEDPSEGANYEIPFSGLRCYGTGETNICEVDGSTTLYCPSISDLEKINASVTAEVEKFLNIGMDDEEDYDEGFEDLEESTKKHKRRLYY